MALRTAHGRATGIAYDAVVRFRPDVYPRIIAPGKSNIQVETPTLALYAAIVQDAMSRAPERALGAAALAAARAMPTGEGARSAAAGDGGAAGDAGGAAADEEVTGPAAPESDPGVVFGCARVLPGTAPAGDQCFGGATAAMSKVVRVWAAHMDDALMANACADIDAGIYGVERHGQLAPLCGAARAASKPFLHVAMAEGILDVALNRTRVEAALPSMVGFEPRTVLDRHLPGLGECWRPHALARSAAAQYL